MTCGASSAGDVRKPSPVQLQGLQRAALVEVVGEDERQPQPGRQLGAEPTRPQQQDLGCRRRCRRGREPLPQPALPSHVAEQPHEIDDVAREVLGPQEVDRPAQGQRRLLARARRPAQAEVDPPGVQRLQGGHVLGHHQGRVVGQHDPARADPDPLRPRRQVGHEDRWRRAGHQRHVVVLGDPEPVVAQFVGPLRQRRGGRQRLGRRPALRDHGQVEHRERRAAHAGISSMCTPAATAKDRRSSGSDVMTSSPSAARRTTQASTTSVAPPRPSNTPALRPRMPSMGTTSTPASSRASDAWRPVPPRHTCATTPPSGLHPPSPPGP